MADVVSFGTQIGDLESP